MRVEGGRGVGRQQGRQVLQREQEVVPVPSHQRGAAAVLALARAAAAAVPVHPRRPSALPVILAPVVTAAALVVVVVTPAAAAASAAAPAPAVCPRWSSGAGCSRPWSRTSGGW